jgi:hypothetical protein
LATAAIDDLGRGSLASVCGNVGDHHVGSLGGIPPGNRVADAVRAAGDDGHLALQLVVRFAHVVPF